MLLAKDVRRDVGVAAMADHKNVKLTCCLSALKIVTKWFSIVDSIIENPVKHIKRSKRDANINGSYQILKSMLHSLYELMENVCRYVSYYIRLWMIIQSS